MEAFAKPVADMNEWPGSREHHVTGPARNKAENAHGDRDRAPGRHDGTPIPAARRAALLRRVVTSEILPRLAAAKSATGRTDIRRTVIATTPVDTQEMVRRLLTEEAVSAIAFLDELMARGRSAEDLYIGIMSDAARFLGEMWEEDRCDFVQVTVGLGRLQMAARSLSPKFQAEGGSGASGYGILLMPAPEEQHSFGLMIVAEFFQRAGWRVAGGPVTAHADAARTVREGWFDVAGFSISADVHSAALAKTIRRVRGASQNRSIVIMIGGPAYLRRPQIMVELGADIAASDARGAVEQATQLTVARIMAA